MPSKVKSPIVKPALKLDSDIRLRKHADYQRVYRDGQRRSLPLMTYFFAARSTTESPETNIGKTDSTGPRVGLTAGRVLGNAVQRNRIKRRMRMAVRLHHTELRANVDLILHPRKTVLDAPFSEIQRDVLNALRAVQKVSERE